MKRFFVAVLAVTLCILLCVNVAFADNSTSYIDVYFPWFGGVTTSSNNITNWATVTQSDVVEVGNTVDQIINYRNYNFSNGYTISNNNDGTFTIGGSSSVKLDNVIVNTGSLISGHTYVVVTGDIYSFRVDYSGLSILSPNTVSVFTASQSIGLTCRAYSNGVQYGTSFLNVFDITNLGLSEVTVDILDSLGIVYPSSYGTYTVSPVSVFSLVPLNGQQQTINNYTDTTFSNIGFDISLDAVSVSSFKLSDYLLDKEYGLVNAGVGLSYMPVDGVPSSAIVNFDEYFTYDIASLDNCIRVAVDQNKVPFYFDTMNSSNLIYSDDSFSNVYIDLNISMGSDNVPVYSLSGNQISISESAFLDRLNSVRYTDNSVSDITGNVTYTGSTSIQDRHNSYFVRNTYINQGAYDFNINVIFPSLNSFNSFSGIWSASVNTSWGEVPVRVESQLVSSNPDTLIKIFKLTCDVPVTGIYTKFNFKYFGSRNAFTTIRIDSSVIDPNGFNTTNSGVNSISGLGYHLTSLFDKFWNKVRSLFLDQDQIAQESIPPELTEQNNTVRSGTEAIHDFETQTFDNIDQSQESIDWETPDSFGSVDSSGSAIGFVASIFTSFFNSIGSNMQNIIVIPLVLGLVLVVLGRGQMALGRALSAPKSKPKGGRK